MVVAFCIDDNNGMLFHNRRQSRDKIVLENLIQEGKKIWIHSFSEKLFAGYEELVTVDDDFLQRAGEGEICFAENQSLKFFEDRINELIIYKWNRKYPADVRLDLDLSKWKLTETAEFSGNSHEKITKERYKK